MARSFFAFDGVFRRIALIEIELMGEEQCSAAFLFGRASIRM
jgi:hypothetical protein